MDKIEAFGQRDRSHRYAAGPALFYAKGYACGIREQYPQRLDDRRRSWTYVRAELVGQDRIYVRRLWQRILHRCDGARWPRLGVTVNAVKAGVNYHFGGPVVARY
jgi:hypothetical protein